MTTTVADIICNRDNQFQLGCRISTALEYLNYIQLPFGAKICNKPQSGCVGVDYILIKYTDNDYISLKLWKYDHHTCVRENVLIIKYLDKKLNRVSTEKINFNDFNHINEILKSIIC
jgi:hypothetical protein